MASTIANILVKKTLKDVATKNINSTNPFEEEVPVYGRDGRPTGKVKKRKRALPVGLSQHDTDVLKKVRRRAYRLDMSLFNLCGIRFGWSSVVGIIPVIGDVIDALMAFMLVRTCATVEGGLPATLQSRMLFNVMLDFGIGLVPFIGDIADALYRANTRNAWLLEVYLTKKAEAERKNTVPMTDALPASPPAAKAPSRGGFFGSKRQPQDEEMAMSQIHDGRSAPPVGQKQQPQPQQQRDQAPQQSGVSTRR